MTDGFQTEFLFVFKKINWNIFWISFNSRDKMKNGKYHSVRTVSKPIIKS